ncbi:50S ribosomal protein L4 [Candidatus Roizmanbacteria bacterium]|nr:50S ribosomal protein L4 [Candidatus Roizmanbacteria bacterium]
MEKRTKSKVVKVASVAKKPVTYAAKVYDVKGNVEQEINLPEAIFSKPIHKALIAQYVRVYLTNQRQGTVSTKTRSEVIGTTKKIYRQKGTGRARHGAKKAPIFVGGGVAFGPKPKDYELKMNKKQRKLAYISALSMKAQEQNIIVLGKSFEKLEPKTKSFVSSLQAINAEKTKILLVLSGGEDQGLRLAGKNVPYIRVAQAKNTNTYEVLSHKKLYVTESGLQVLVDQIQSNNDNESNNS